MPPWRKDLHGSFCGCCKPEQGTIIAVQYFIRALSVGGTACSALWYRVCCGSGLCAFGRPEHIMPCGLFADPSFVMLFIFIGNLGRFAAFSGWLQHILTGHEVWVSVLASQVTSNVPAAILLSGFTENIRSLIIGTNLGGLGTLIASMASLISYREIARELPLQKGRYFALFTVSNILFVTVLMGAWALAG